METTLESDWAQGGELEMGRNSQNCSHCMRCFEWFFYIFWIFIYIGLAAWKSAHAFTGAGA